MKKFIQVLSASLVGMSMMVGVAAADTTCSISGTGVGSTNTVTCVDSSNVSVSCVNNVVVSNTNNQGASSGNANNSGNNSSGGSTSGSSSNSNSTTIQLGASCAPVAAGSSSFTVPTSAVLGSSTTQVKAPAVGGVQAGGGAGTKTSELTIAGLVASFGAIVAGVAFRKRASQF